MRSIAIFDYLNAAVSRGATFPELMELLDTYQRLSREGAALAYELASPFGRPRQASASPAERSARE